MPDPTHVPAPPAKPQPIEFILIPAGWVKIDKGSFQVVEAANIPDIGRWTDDQEERWYLCTSEGRQIVGRCDTIAAMKYAKVDSK